VQQIGRRPRIPESEREAVFAPGVSSKSDGGFGLARVAQIVAALGWRVRITESSEGSSRVELGGVASP
jgi:sensor histidine kinase regulating citrate/malate metabolism